MQIVYTTYTIQLAYTGSYRTYIRVSVFLHFTEIYRTGVHIIQMKSEFHWYKCSKNGDFLWFYRRLFIKIVVFRNDLGENPSSFGLKWRIMPLKKRIVQYVQYGEHMFVVQYAQILEKIRGIFRVFLCKMTKVICLTIW